MKEKEELTNPDAVKNDDIRLFDLFNKGISGAAKPVDNPPIGGASWLKMDKDVASYCSAVGYYFPARLTVKPTSPSAL